MRLIISSIPFLNYSYALYTFFSYSDIIFQKFREVFNIRGMENSKKNWYLFQCNNKILKNHLIGLWGIAIIIQAIVSTCEYAIIRLPADHLNEVFSATCTVAVLGNAILSLLFGAYDKKTLGIPFQDTLNYSLIGNEQKFTIEVMTASILFAMVYYIFQWYNLLFAVLIQNVCLLLFSCRDLWRFLSDKETQKKTTTEIIRNVSPSRYAVYVDNWFKELDHALVPNNKEETQEYCDLFKLILESAPENESQIRSCIGRHLQIYFNTACDKLGFVEAFDLLQKVIVYALQDEQSDTQIALKYLEQLRTKDQVDIVNREVIDLVREIFDDPKFNDQDKMLFAYNYFCAVFDNVQMSSARKSKQIDDILTYFCDMHESTYGLIKSKIIMNIVKYKILNNEDLIGRKNLFCTLIESLKKRSSFSSDKFYIATISEIYRAFFFAIYLKENYRRDLLTLFHSITNEKDRTPLSFMTLIFSQREKVVNWLAMDVISFSEKPKLFWDYYSLATNWKNVVWTMEEVTIFAFCVCNLIGSDTDEHPFVSILESNEYSNDEKISICKTLLELYSSSGFSEVMQKRIQQISMFSKMPACSPPVFWKAEHSYYQEKIIDLLTANNQTHFSAETMKNSDIWEAVQNLYSEPKPFLFDPSHSIFPGTRYTFSPTYVRLNQHFWKDVPQRVNEKIRKYLNSFVGDTLPILGINFKIQGVDTLLEALETESFQYRNYKYTNDFALGQELRNTSKFKKLSSILEKIPCDSSSQLHGHFFLKQKKIPFNFQLRYHLSNLSPEQCADYAECHKNSEGMYEIGDCRFDYDYAVKYAKENVLTEEITIFINIALDSDSGFQIRFER